MKYDSKRFIIYGTAGFLVACLIFTTTAMVPWSELAKSLSPFIPPNEQPILLNPTNVDVTVDLSISNFTEPLGPGSEANVTISVISEKDVSNVTVQIALTPIYVSTGTWPNITWIPIGPLGIDLVGGNFTWTTNLVANVSVSATIRIKATEVGFGVITGSTIWWETPSTFYKNEEAVYIQVLEGNVVIHDSNETIVLQ